jgi:Flp pilus assembly protein TadD
MHARAQTGMPVAMAPVGVEISMEAKVLLARARNAAFAEVQQGRMGLGLSLLQEALEQEPMSHDLLSDMAALLLSAGELARAASFAQRALALQPQHGVSLYTLGFALSGLGEVDQAQVVLGGLLRDGPARQSLMLEAPDLSIVVMAELARIQTAQRGR